MMQLSVGELTSVIGGKLCLGALPPLAGEYEPVRRIVVECQEVAPGDVYWGLVRRGFDGSRLADTAFMRGALGVVVGGRHVEPWAGRFSIAVPDANTALEQLARCLRARDCGSNRRCQPSRTSTQVVQDWLEGQPIDLEAVLERLPGGPDCVVA
jgi:UDP-N-acetylmuramyl pentapeptide synthase